MSNSSLVVYTEISSNKNSPRNHVIDTITIHHMAGNLSIETCGHSFAKATRRASSNYGIGSDGRIGMYVEEKDRAWTSGNRVNDHRAITIEVANSDAGVKNKTWEVTDKAYSALINLCADICQRNGITKLVWGATKTARVNHTNGCNMTVHRDFEATACPGDYLFAKMPDIAEKVNKILSGESVDTKVKPEVALPIIRVKNKGDNVTLLQEDLNYLGYKDENGNSLDVDGSCGNHTINALKSFQKANGLTADGVYGAKSYAKMQTCLK